MSCAYRFLILLAICLGMASLTPAAALAAKAEAEKADAEKEEEDDKPAAAYANIVPFVELEPLVLPMIQEGRVTHHVEFQIILEVRPEKKEWIKLVMPKLLDRFIVELHGLLSLRFVREQPDLRPILKERLTIRSKELVGDAVKSVLLSRVQKLRPISARRTR